MNTFFYFDRKVSAFFLLFVMFITVSCSEDDKPLSKTLATIWVPSTSLDNSHRTWIFLTDEEGELLGKGQQAYEGVEMIFERPEGFKGNTFTLNIVAYVPYVNVSVTDWNVFSYTGIKPGSFSLPEIKTTTYSPIGEATVVVNNVPAPYSPRIIGGGVRGVSTISGAGTYTAKTSVLENNKWMVFNMSAGYIGSQPPRYAYFSSINAGETKTVSFTDLTEASHHTITFDTEIDVAQVTIGLPGGRGNLDFYGVNNKTSVPVYYPEEVTEDFNSGIALYDGNDYQAYYTLGPAPTIMKYLSATIGSLKVSEEKITYSTTGEYDYCMLYSSEYWDSEDWRHWLNWQVYSNDDASKQFMVSELPEVITNEYPELLNISKNFDLISLTANDRLSGYADFIRQQLKADDPITKPLTDTRVFRRSFPSGTRQSSKANLERFEIRQ